MQSNGHWPDIIDQWIEYLTPIQTAPQFRLWSGISMVAGALEHRVWAETDRYSTYAHLYVMLVGRPGVGKYVVQHVKGMWTDALQPNSQHPAFHVASDSMTFASLVDELARAGANIFTPSGAPYVYHSLQIAAEELRLLLPAYIPEVVSRLDSLWNTPPVHSETRRTGSATNLRILNPQLNLLLGAQPAYISRTFPDDIWETGIGRRIVMIYADRGELVDIFTGVVDRGERERDAILQQLGVLSQLQGRMEWSADAWKCAREWHMAGGPPTPTHSKLVSYNTTRTQTLVKLSMIAAASRTGGLLIMHEDVEKATRWLLEAESLMPDVFRSLLGKSDKEVIEELHRFVTAEWSRRKRQPVRGAILREFLLQRVPHERIETLLQSCLTSDILACPIGGDFWQPRPWMGQGVE